MLDEELHDREMSLANGEMQRRHVVVIAQHEPRLRRHQFPELLEVAVARACQRVPDLRRRDVRFILELHAQAGLHFDRLDHSRTQVGTRRLGHVGARVPLTLRRRAKHRHQVLPVVEAALPRHNQPRVGQREIAGRQFGLRHMTQVITDRLPRSSPSRPFRQTGPRAAGSLPVLLSRRPRQDLWRDSGTSRASRSAAGTGATRAPLSNFFAAASSPRSLA